MRQKKPRRIPRSAKAVRGGLQPASGRRGGTSSDAGAEFGTLYLVGTPIGNLEDITWRAVRILREVDLIAAEDTRRARILLSHYEVSTKTVSFFAANEQRRSVELLRRLLDGQSIAVISSAGMPGLSDPGAHLLRAALAEGIAVDVIPGPSAMTTAVVLSGMPCHRFVWLGFLPRSGRRRRDMLARLRDATETAVLYESPNRLAATLSELASAVGDREAAISRELTKLHQEVIRGALSQLAQRCQVEPVRGEVTLVIEGKQLGAVAEDEAAALSDEVRLRLEAGDSPRQIAEALSGADGPARHSRRVVYQLALRLAGTL